MALRRKPKVPVTDMAKVEPKPALKRRDPSAAEMEELISLHPEAEGLTYEEIVKRILDAPSEGKSDAN